MKKLLNYVNTWTQGIIVSVIIATIIEMILPDGNNKKYVKVILSIYILFTIAYPLINIKSNGNLSFASIVTNASKEIEEYDTDSILLDNNSYIEKTYKEKLSEEIIKSMDEKGYKVLDLKIYIENSDEENYGQINSVILNIEKKHEEEKTVTNKVNEININISNSNTLTPVQDEQISDHEISNLKEYIESTYSVDKQKIHINE